MRRQAGRFWGEGDALPAAGFGPRSLSSAGALAQADAEAGHLSRAVWDSLVRLVGRVMAAYRIPLNRVVGHRERPSGRAQGKTCPGFDVAVIRNLLRQQE